MTLRKIILIFPNFNPCIIDVAINPIDNGTIVNNIISILIPSKDLKYAVESDLRICQQ